MEGWREWLMARELGQRNENAQGIPETAREKTEARERGDGSGYMGGNRVVQGDLLMHR